MALTISQVSIITIIICLVIIIIATYSGHGTHIWPWSWSWSLNHHCHPTHYPHYFDHDHWHNQDGAGIVWDATHLVRLRLLKVFLKNHKTINITDVTTLTLMRSFIIGCLLKQSNYFTFNSTSKNLKNSSILLLLLLQLISMQEWPKKKLQQQQNLTRIKKLMIKHKTFKI